MLEPQLMPSTFFPKFILSSSLQMFEMITEEVLALKQASDSKNNDTTQKNYVKIEKKQKKHNGGCC